MSIRRVWLVALAFAVATYFVAPAHAQATGKNLPAVELEGYAQTGAKTFDDYLGRAVLFEFFAYW